MTIVRVLSFCIIAGFYLNVCASQKDYREDPAEYWDYKQYLTPPAYKTAGFPESQVSDLQDILFDGVPYKGKKTQVFAYIGYPKTPMPEGGYPAVLLVHGGGGTAYAYFTRLWRDQGFAVLAIDWYNTRPDNKMIGNKEKKPYRIPLDETGLRNHIQTNVANMVLAHSLLRSLPKVNKDKTLFVGLSWGSWYGTAVTALDPRFKGAIEIYCGDINLNKKFLLNGRFVHAAKVPMYWICSTNDANVTMQTLQKSFDDCPTIVNKSLVIKLPHSHVGFRFPACWRMAKHFLCGEPALPKLGKVTVKDNTASVKILEKGKGIIDAKFCYTADGEEIKPHKRKWQTLPVEQKGDVLSVTFPKGIKQGFFSVWDEKSRFHDCCGSSDVIFFQNENK